LKEAASLGFAAIGLSYPNASSVKSRCANDLSCYGTVRANQFNGTKPSAASSVTPDDAVDFRLSALLKYLHRTQRSGPWGRFLSAGQVDWSRVVIGGHSQGGGEAAFIGTIQHIEGVLMLSAPVDSTNGALPEPARYLSADHRTPMNRYVGFDHTADPSHAKILTDWAALGLGRFGPAVSIDTARPPYLGSRQLVTSVSVPDHTVSNAPHDSTAVDLDTPLCPDGSPRFAPVWRYMLQVAGGLRVTRVSKDC
jgi:hypothetical protein